MGSSVDFMMDHGTSAFVDYREGGIGGVEAIRRATDPSPVKGLILGRDPVIFDEDASPEEVRRRVRRILWVADGIAPSGMGEITDETAMIITEECRRRGKIASIHVAEHRKSQIRSLEETGMTEVERALRAGFRLLVHLTHPMRDDLELVRSSGADVVICPGPTVHWRQGSPCKEDA